MNISRYIAKSPETYLWRNVLVTARGTPVEAAKELYFKLA